MGSTQLIGFPNILKSIIGPDDFAANLEVGSGLQTMAISQNIFENGGSTGFLNEKGKLVGNSFGRDFISVNNPLTTERIRRVTRNIRERICRDLPYPLDDLCDWSTKTVTDIITDIIRLGPEKLKMGMNGNILDMNNSSLYANFGGEVLDKLGVGSLPSITGRMGGAIVGPSHEMGGVAGELEGGEFVINKSAASEIGYGTLSSINSSPRDFRNSLIKTSSMNNALLTRLIEVVEEKDLSVTFVNENGNEIDEASSNIRRSSQLSYRNTSELV